MTPCFTLKLLNGALLGRELQLPAGAFTIGDGDADLCLPLEGGGSATLEVSAQQVTLTSATPCWVAGRPRAPGPLPLDAAIDLAGVGFVLGAAGSSPASRPMARRRPRWLPWLGAAVAFACGTLPVLLTHHAPAPAAPAAAPTPQVWLAQALRSEPAVHARWQNADELVLEGRCRDTQRLAPLLQRLAAAGIHLRQELVCDDELLRAVQAQLSGAGYTKVEVSIAPDGSAQLDGPLRNDSHFAALAASLDRLPGLRGWQVSDRGADELNELLPRLESAGLLAGLSGNRDEHGWVFSGELAPPRRATLERLLERLDARPGATPLRFVRAANAATAADYLPAPLTSIGGNPRAPFIELGDGTRLQSGASVRRGMRIVAISDAGVSLADGQRLIFLPL